MPLRWPTFGRLPEAGPGAETRAAAGGFIGSPKIPYWSMVAPSCGPEPGFSGARLSLM